MLDLKKTLDEIKEAYELYPEKFSALLSGDSGTGKTTLWTTAKKPIYAYQFDPDGVKSVRDKIDWKGIYVDVRFDRDDPKNPATYEAWGKDFTTKKNSGFFSHFGTVVIDGLTTFGDAIMNNVLRKANRIGMIPKSKFGGDNDYVTQMNELSIRIKEFMTLPCDFLATCHLETEQNQETGRIKSYPLITGKLKTRIPLLFTDIFVCLTRPSKDGLQYRVLTKNDGYYIARTRTGMRGKLSLYEIPDIKVILRKAGLPVEDKPAIAIPD